MIKYIYFQNFVSKAWEIGILMLLPILAMQGVISITEVGLYGALFAITQMLGGIVSSLLAQKFGRYYSMILSLTLYLFSWFLLAISDNMLVFGLAYTIAGLSAGLIEATGTVLAAKLFPKGERVGVIAAHGMAGDVGRIAATSITSLLVALFGVSLFSFGAALITITVLIYQSVVLRKITALFDKVDETVSRARVYDLSYFKEKKYLYAILVQLLDSFGSASLYLFLPLLLQSKGFPELLAGQLSVLLMVGYFSGRLLLSFLSRKFGLMKALLFGEYVMITCILLLLLVGNPIIIAILLFFAGAATRGTSPVAKAMIIEALPEKASVDIAVGQNQLLGRLLTTASRPFYASIGQYFGMPMAFIASAAVIFLVTFPALRYNSEK